MDQKLSVHERKYFKDIRVLRKIKNAMMKKGDATCQTTLM